MWDLLVKHGKELVETGFGYKHAITVSRQLLSLSLLSSSGYVMHVCPAIRNRQEG